MGLLDFFTGRSKAKKLVDFMSRDAIFIDVRTKGEYQSYAVPGTRNIPLAEFGSQVSKLKKENKPVVLFCASGMRSASANAAAKAAGLESMNLGTFRKAEEVLTK